MIRLAISLTLELTSVSQWHRRLLDTVSKRTATNSKHSVSRVATVTVNPVDSLGSVNGLTLYCQWTVRVNVTVHITLRTCVRPGATENFVTENDETDGLINSQHGFIGKFILRFGWRFIILVRLGWRFITLVTCACVIVYRVTPAA